MLSHVSQVTRFDRFRFLSTGVHKGPNGLARCGGTGSPYNCSLWLLHHLMLQNTWREVERRLDICRATGGCMWSSAEEHQNFGTFCIFQCSPLVSICISLGNINFCYWRKFCRTPCINTLWTPGMGAVRGPLWLATGPRVCEFCLLNVRNFKNVTENGLR
jgi:hypothetical protein